MPISIDQLKRNFIVVDDTTTVAQVRDRARASGDRWLYIVARLGDGRYAAFYLLDLIAKLQEYSPEPVPQMLRSELRQVPDFLEARAMPPVEQDSMSTQQGQRLQAETPDICRVVTAKGEVIGLLAQVKLGTTKPVDPNWLDHAPQELPTANGGSHAEPPHPVGDSGSTPPGPEEGQKRFINAEIEGHKPDESLKLGEQYTVAFDVDTEQRATAVSGEEFPEEVIGPDEQMVELTVQLSSDDFEVFTEPQKLRVPRTGRSKGKARFDFEPKHDGLGVLNAVFLKDGAFIRLMTLKLPVVAAEAEALGSGGAGEPNRARTLSVEELTVPEGGSVSAPAAVAPKIEVTSAGRPLDSAFAVQPRDLSIIITYSGRDFQVVTCGAMKARTTLPLDKPELDQIITQMRTDLLSIVDLTWGPDNAEVYQEGIEIPPEANQKALQLLAKAGFRVFQRIFERAPSFTRFSDELRKLAQGERLKIQILSEHFTLPWGLLYVADEYDPEKVDPEMFLGLRHIIEYFPLQQEMQVGGGKIASQPALTVSVNVNEDIDQQFGMPIIKDQLKFWEGIGEKLGVKVIVRRKGDEFTAALANPETPDQIAYLYCHAVSRGLAEGGGPDTATLVLSGGQQLTLEDLNLIAPTRKLLPAAPLVFINACESAELSPLFYDGFVPYFMAKGARGVIGTEAQTPALFAAEWARRFFQNFLSGKSLGEVFLELRREFYFQHNNILGLLYALYCDADTLVTPGLQVH